MYKNSFRTDLRVAPQFMAFLQEKKEFYNTNNGFSKITLYKAFNYSFKLSEVQIQFLNI